MVFDFALQSDKVMLVRLRTDLIERLTPIRLLLINADGFLTENLISFYLNNPGIKNGYHINNLKKLGVDSIAYSMKNSNEISSITDRLGIDVFHQGVSQTFEFYSDIKKERTVLNENVAFFGWDNSDIAVLKRVNFSFAPADAPLEVKANSYYVTYKSGEDAVREGAHLISRVKAHSERFPNI